jgi:single-strand DNA-binding protein
MNRVILLGRLCADPETRVTPQTNSTVVRFSLAVNRSFKGTDGITADFFNVVAWKQTGEFISKYFVKGQQVLIEGNLRNNNWTDKDGIKRFSTEVHADHVYFADSKRDGQTHSEPTTGTSSYGNATISEQNAAPVDPDEDLPF